MKYTVHPLKVGEWTDPEARIFYLGDCSRKTRVFSYFWLVKSSRHTILVDSGVALRDGRKINPGLRQADSEHPLNQLKKHGLSPAAVTHVILTHAHWDHLSPVIMQYKNAEVYLQKKEWDAVVRPLHPWFAKFAFTNTLKSLRRQFAERFHIVSGDRSILPGIRVLLTGGHTPGSQAVSVRTEKGKAVITGDVVFTYRSLEEDIPCGFNSNLTECFLAMERIRKTADVVFPSHDPLVLKETMKRKGE